MNRRTFLCGLTLGTLAAPLATEAQPASKIPRVGLLRPGSAPDPYVDVFRQGLRDLGWIEGRTIALEYRWAEGHSERFPSLAAELVKLRVDVVVTQGEEGARAVKQATGTIPIVMATSGDPVGAGLVTSLAHPGGNVTGLSAVQPDVTTKQLELLKDAVPRLSRVAMRSVSGNVTMANAVKEAQGAAETLKLAVQVRNVRTPADLEPAFAQALSCSATSSPSRTNGESLSSPRSTVCPPCVPGASPRTAS